MTSSVPLHVPASRAVPGFPLHRLAYRWMRVAGVALASIGLATCGGGRDGSALLQDQPTSQKSLTLAAAATAGASPDWIDCAPEGGRCDFSGVHTVRYGAGAGVVEQERAGPVSCDNATFGDPAVGTVKSCAYARRGWSECAVEGGACAFSGIRTVRYGAAGRWTAREMTSAADCGNATFGDPSVGTVKSCWVLDPQSADATIADDACDVLAPIPSLPADHLTVTSFCVEGRCAAPDDGQDDTDAIDRALDASQGRVLVFPPGRYLISRSLRVKHPGVTLWGPGATIHATNWDDQSIIVEADDVSIYSFRLTAVTVARGSRAEHTRIAIYGPAASHPVVRNTIIRDNQIVPAGEPGTPLANSATAAGIFVNAADGFLIAGNTVSRTLADGIHLTGGARNGRVIGNTVRDTGDDMIAMVSYAYADPNRDRAATIAAGFAASRQRYLDRNIVVARNQLSGQYWGRGIAVVGGADITLRGNVLTNLPYGAAVLLAREGQSGSYGVENILVDANTIRDEQTLDPPYDFDRKFATHFRTGHGAIEVHATTFLDELAVPALREGFAVHRIALRNNVVERTSTAGVRAGVGYGSEWRIGERAATGSAPITDVRIDGNAFAAIGSDPALQLFGNVGAECAGNVLDGKALDVKACGHAAPVLPATGATMTCGR